MKKNIVINVIILLLIATATVCGYFFVREYMIAKEEMSEYADLRNEYTTIVCPPAQENSSDPSLLETEDPNDLGLPYVEVDFDALLQINPDTVGWIAIPDTNISYPVVQTVNNSKYLNISFEGSQSKAGTLFADKDNNMQPIDANIVIYGHNMGAGRSDMFNSLLLYKDYDYYMSHRYIQFDTIYQQHGFWKVFAVVELDVNTTNFIYQQMNFRNEDDFMIWVRNAMMRSIHKTDMTVLPDAHVLTLSTCDRSIYGRSGRFLVFAVKVYD